MARLQFAALMNQAKANTERERAAAIAKSTQLEKQQRADLEREVLRKREEEETRRKLAIVRAKKEEEARRIEAELAQERERKRAAREAEAKVS